MLATMPLSDVLALDRSFTSPVSACACSQKYRKLAFSTSSSKLSSSGARALLGPAIGAAAKDRIAPDPSDETPITVWSSARRVGLAGTTFNVMRLAAILKSADADKREHHSNFDRRCYSIDHGC